MTTIRDAIEQHRDMVNQKSTGRALLYQTADYLDGFDAVSVTEDGPKTTLRFVSTRSTPIGSPTDDSGDITLVYDAQINDWDCKGYLYRTHVDFDHPKLFFSTIQQAAISEARLKLQVLSRVRWFMERYAGDEDQFAYRLGIDLGTFAVVDMVKQAANFAVLRAGGKYSPNLHSVPDFELWFSRATTPLGQSYWKFGWIEAPEFHLYSMNNAGFARCERELQEWQNTCSTFLNPLITLRWN